MKGPEAAPLGEPSSPAPKKQPLPALTGIRFFLAIWVVIYHQIPPVETVLGAIPGLHNLSIRLLHTGYSAVTGFFVLSGFVLAYNYSLEQAPTLRSVRRFAAARFSRIYPAYLVGLLLLLPLAFYRFAMGIESMPAAQEQGSFLLNLLLLQAWLPQTALSWNFPGWSLSNEAFFYACFPFLGVLLWRLRRTGSILTMFGLLWLVSCIAPLIAVWLPLYHWGDLPATTYVIPTDASTWADVIRYNPLLRLPEFCAGILLAKLYALLPSRHNLFGRGGLLYLPAGLAIIATLALADSIPYPLLHNGLLIPLFSCLILGLALGGGIPARWLSTSSLQLLGNASYSMYILHAPIYTWLAICFERILGREPFQGWVWFFTYLLVVIFGSILFFKTCEEPAHRALRRKLSPR